MNGGNDPLSIFIKKLQNLSGLKILNVKNSAK